MNLYKFLLDNYGEDEPIFVADIEIQNYTSNNIRQNIFKLEKEGKIKHYDRGIYYIPTETIFGESKLIFEDVLKKKYVSNDNETFGYFTGLYFKNVIGLTTQMTNIPEITTNKESSKKRTIELRSRKAIVRKSNIEINESNAKILQFFDLFKDLTLDEVNCYKKELVQYIQRFQLTKEMVIEYLAYYSNEVKNLMIRSGLIYEFI
ncbi:MAG: hypothetical protein LUG60_13765 [Erysipelotrichaceae bacterium]|nr:hypothetical protein [Erysipelotrichaceae bacterium]